MKLLSLNQGPMKSRLRQYKNAHYLLGNERLAYLCGFNKLTVGKGLTFFVLQYKLCEAIHELYGHMAHLDIQHKAVLSLDSHEIF